MPRDLGEVLHYFISEPEEEPDRPRAPIVAAPVAERDVVRSAFLWNLTIELARLGVSAAAVAPNGEPDHGLWPGSGADALGAQFIPTLDAGLESLVATAREQSLKQAERRTAPGLVLLQVPPDWLSRAGATAPDLDWYLLFTTPEIRDLQQSYDLVARLHELSPSSRIGVTVHGARRIDEARHAFLRLAEASERNLARELTSYGLLLDDLDVYRAIVSRRAIGLAHPQSRAAQALRDVARLLLGDGDSGSQP